MKLIEAIELPSYSDNNNDNLKYLDASKYLPVDWLLWYDYVSESMQSYNFLYRYDLVTILYFILKNGNKRYECDNVCSNNHKLSKLKLSPIQEVTTHTIPCTYLSYFPPTEILPRDGLLSIQICIIDDLYYNGSRGRHLKYNYISHQASDFWAKNWPLGNRYL